MAQPAGNDKTTLFGWIGIIGGLCCGLIGIIFGIMSIVQAQRVGKSPVLGIIAIVIGIITAIGWPSIWYNR